VMPVQLADPLAHILAQLGMERQGSVNQVFRQVL
jgi:hypothetical protein